MRFIRSKVPAALQAVFARDEHLLAGAQVDGGDLLAATRYGLYLVRGEEVTRFDWHLISKARLVSGTLFVTLGSEQGRWPDGAVLLRDEPELALPLTHSARLTDLVHHRVRGSVLASRYLDWPGSGAWVVLRRVTGRDGLTVQVRLDADADPDGDGFSEAVAAVVDEIWPETVPRPDSTPED